MGLTFFTFGGGGLKSQTVTRQTLTGVFYAIGCQPVKSWVQVIQHKVFHVGLQ